MQIALYSLVTRDYSIEETVSMAAEAGFDAVDFRYDEDGVHFPLDISDAEVERVRTLVGESGMHVSGITTYFLLGAVDPAEVEQHISNLRRASEIAQLMGAHLVRCKGADFDAQVGYERQRELFRVQAEQAGAMAAQFDVEYTLEQHGASLFASAGQNLDMMRGLQTDRVGVIYDPGNCFQEGYERVEVQINMLGKLIKQVHVKNAIQTNSEELGWRDTTAVEWRRLDSGLLDWARIIQLLREVGYDGYLTLEDFGSKFDTVQEKLNWSVEYLRGII